MEFRINAAYVNRIERAGKAGRAREGFKTRFPGGRWIQGNIRCGGDTRFPRRDRAEVQNESIWQRSRKPQGPTAGRGSSSKAFKRLIPMSLQMEAQRKPRVLGGGSLHMPSNVAGLFC